MEKTIETVREKFDTVRTGRASPKILNRINVDYYGTLAPLITIANASTPDSQTIVIQPFDRTIIDDIENRTSEHIDTKAITENIRNEMINSRKARYVNKAQRQKILEEMLVTNNFFAI